ncbi:MAG: methyl-accepting chemotaxis protein [Clostridiaceae bacterium]|nr:methyl-accepting chemotaxis protein [Clostridiaceae bacterium]
MKSIKTQLITVIIIVTLLPVIVSTSAFSFYTKASTTQSIKQNNLTITKNISENVSSYIEKAYTLSEEIANSTAVKKSDAVEQKQILEGAAGRNKYFDLLYIQDTKGDQTARSKGTLANRANRWWFTEMMSKQKPFVSKSYYSITTNSAVTSIFLPIYNSDSKFIGIFGADLVLNQLQKLVESYSVGKESYIYVVDSEGVVIAHPEKKQVTELYNYKTFKKTVIEKDASGNALKDATGNTKTKAENIKIAQGFKDITVKALSGNSGSIEFKDTNGKVVISSYSTIKLPGESNNWGVITVQPKSAALASINSSIMLITTIALIIVLVVLIITFIFANGFTKPLINLNNIIKQAALGDLTVTSNYSSKSEIGAISSSFNIMIGNTKQLINHILEASKHLQISSENLVATAEETSASIDEVVTTISSVTGNSKSQTEKSQSGLHKVMELGSDIESMAALVDSSTHLSNGAIKLSEAGIIVMNTLEEKSLKTIEASNSVSSIIDKLSNKTNMISNIVETISAISQQTNLLALNAAIEAARAGEAGKGFAVVAEEVRKLSDNTAKSSQEVRSVISEIKKDITDAQDNMQYAGEVVSDQMGAVNDVKSNFDEITEEVKEIMDNITELNNKLEAVLLKKDSVTTVIKEVYTNSTQISASSEEIVAITEQQAAAIGELTKFTVELNQLSGELDENIKHFKL